MSILLVRQRIELIPDQLSANAIMQLIETAARTCYQSQDKATKGSAQTMYKKLWKSGHHSVLEHAHISLRVVTSRAIGNELVRHRHTEQADDVLVDTAISQESTRYCAYTYTLPVILPNWFTASIEGPLTYDVIRSLTTKCTEKELNWLYTVARAAQGYQTALVFGNSPQEARDLLPLATKTEIVITASVRQWIQIIKLRRQKAAHPDIQQLMQLILNCFEANGYWVLFKMFEEARDEKQ